MIENVRGASVPGKTFFVGEYLALAAGPSLVLTTNPRFSLQVRPAAKFTLSGFPAGSPGALWVERHVAELGAVELSFDDPHQGRGGLGASSAQFALAYVLTRNWPHPISELLRDYRECAWNGEGLAPSGADVVAQLSGGLSFYDPRTMRVEALPWGFSDVAATLLHTGQKLATHEHLRATGEIPETFVTQSEEIVRAAVRAVRELDAQALIRGVNDYATALRAGGFTGLNTLSLLDELASEPWALAAKGCGALGADVLLVLHLPERASDVTRWGLEHKMSLCGRIGPGEKPAAGLQFMEGVAF